MSSKKSFHLLGYYFILIYGMIDLIEKSSDVRYLSDRHYLMEKKISKKMISTNDSAIRSALRDSLKERHALDPEVRIIEELGVRHGTTRIDIAVVNGIMHGYEIKSDRDTLERLPEQMTEFNTVFDRITLVVGKHHLYRAIHIVPDWWGVTIAKINIESRVVFQTIREPEDNKKQDKVSIARLLWREEALRILEEHNRADGVRSKPREFVYRRLADILEADTLKKRVRKILLVPRQDWRFGLTQLSRGG